MATSRLNGIKPNGLQVNGYQNHHSDDESPSPKTLFSPFPQDPESMALPDLMNNMKTNINTLTQTFGALQRQGSQASSLGPKYDVARQLHALRRSLIEMDEKQQQDIDELTSLIQEELYDRIVEQLGYYVQQRIKDRVEQLLPQRVEEQLRAQVPSALAAELLDHRRQLEAVKLNLYNSEARRENGLLKYEHLNRPLHPLLRPTGEPCLRFPATLAQFFALTPAQVHDLMKDFNIPINESDPRERNLNKLMQYIGIGFQMVPSPSKPFRGQPLITFA